MQHFSLVADFFERTDQIRPPTRKVRLPEILSIHKQNGRYSPFDLRDWFRKEAARLADAFDKRNGNSHVSCELAGDRALGLGVLTPDYPTAPEPVDEVVVWDRGPTKPSNNR